MLRDSVSAMEFSRPVCTITAVSKDLVRRPTRISYDLSLATLSHELGVSFSRLRTIRREVTRPVAGRPSMFVLRSMRKHPEIFGGRFGKSCRTGAVKAIDNTQGRASRLSSSGYRSPDYSLSPAAATGLRSSPRSKRMTRPCARVLCSRAVSVGNAGSRCGNPGRPGRADVAPPRPFRRSQLCTLCWPALLRRPLAVRSRLGPNVDGVAGRIQRSELLPSRDALRA